MWPVSSWAPPQPLLPWGRRLVIGEPPREGPRMKQTLYERVAPLQLAVLEGPHMLRSC